MQPTRSFPFALRLPIFSAPLFLVSGPDLVVAACKAGIIGSFPTANARPIEELDRWMHTITRALDAARHEAPGSVVGPWCANVVTHSSNTRLAEDLALIAQYRPPVVVTALGSPRSTIEVVHAYGGLVFVDVPNLTLARKAVNAGADGLACICAGAGGHTGSITPFAFVDAIREFFDGYIVVGGGIGSGNGIAGAVAAGADFAYVGTSFIPTRESMAAERYKQMLVDATLDDLVTSAGVTGTSAIWLKQSLREAGLDPDHMPEAPPRSYDSTQPFAARRWKDVWAAGQGVGSVKRVEPVREVVLRLEREFRAACARLQRLGEPPIVTHP